MWVEWHGDNRKKTFVPHPRHHHHPLPLRRHKRVYLIENFSKGYLLGIPDTNFSGLKTLPALTAFNEPPFITEFNCKNCGELKILKLKEKKILLFKKI